MSTPTKPLALVIGATGGIGGALADRLLAHGWRVRAMNRNPDKARATHPALDWVKGDAMVEADVVAAARGAQIIVHGANPAGYRNWSELAPAMLNSTIAAARDSGARILFPGNVYNYGPDAFPSFDETTPQNPVTRKGRLRVQMEQTLMNAGVKVLLVRAGDFLGTRPGSDWLSNLIATPGKPVTSATWPGPLEVAHAWAWLPDLAETFVRLLKTDLADVETFNFGGYAITGHAFVAALGEAVGKTLPTKRMPWIALQVASPFNETFREMLEMRYLWDKVVLMDNAKLLARLEAEPHTPLPDALRTALIGQGSLQGETAMAA